MAHNGWVKLHRKLLDNPLAGNPQWAWLWIVLLLKASHQDKVIMWNGKPRLLKAGALITGRNKLAKESRLSPSTVERALAYLEAGQQIGQVKNSKFRLISIVKWKKYQEQRTAKKHIQEDKEVKELNLRNFRIREIRGSPGERERRIKAEGGMFLGELMAEMGLPAREITA